MGKIQRCFHITTEFLVRTVNCASISLFIKILGVMQVLSPTVVTIFTIMVTSLSYIRDYTYLHIQPMSWSSSEWDVDSLSKC